MGNEFVDCTVEEIASPVKNAIVGGPFGSDLVSKDYVLAGVPVIRGTNLGHGRWVAGRFAYVTARKAERLSGNCAKPGDLVFTQRGTLGQVAIVPAVGPDCYLISQSQMKLTVDTTKADTLYLYYVFTSNEQQEYIRQNAIQTGVPHTNLGILKRTPLTLPSLAQQRAIAHILGTLDDKIELNRRTNATLEALARALFQSWFVDFDPVRAKAAGQTPARMDKATSDLFPSEFEDSELGEIPRGWGKRRLNEVSRVTIGKTPPRKEPEWFSESKTDIPWVSIRDLGTSGTFVSQTSERLTQKGVDRFNVRLVPRDTVILSFKLTVGRVAITDVELTTNEAIAHFWIDPASGVTTEFLYLSLLSFNFELLGSTSSIATAVNSDSVRGIEICIPSAELMGAFSAIVRPLFSRIRSNQAETRTLIETRDALLPRLLSGELNSSGLGE